MTALEFNAIHGGWYTATSCSTAGTRSLVRATDVLRASTNIEMLQASLVECTAVRGINRYRMFQWSPSTVHCMPAVTHGVVDNNHQVYKSMLPDLH